jgi:hypothetical protein
VGVAGGDWKHRARLAEAEAAAHRTVARAEELKRHAAVAELENSISWKLTKPLRVANRMRRARREPSERSG